MPFKFRFNQNTLYKNFETEVFASLSERTIMDNSYIITTTMKKS